MSGRDPGGSPRRAARTARPTSGSKGMLGAVSCRVVNVADMSPVPCGTDGASACTSSCATTRPRAIAKACDAGREDREDGPRGLEPMYSVRTLGTRTETNGARLRIRGGVGAGGRSFLKLAVVWLQQDDAHLPGRPISRASCCAGARRSWR